MRRIASPKIGKGQPETDWARPSLPPARRTGSRRGRAPGLRYRAGLRPPQSARRVALARAVEQRKPAWEISDRPPQSASRVLGRAANQREPAWEVVDDLPEDIPVLPRELKVIETYLAALLNESFERVGLETEKPASETAKRDVE